MRSTQRNYYVNFSAKLASLDIKIPFILGKYIVVNYTKLSERRAAALVGISKSVLRYQKKLKNEQLIAEIRRLAGKYSRSGYRMIYRKLKLSGWKVNHKKVERIYKLEKLSLRRKTKRKYPAHLRLVMPPAQELNQCWTVVISFRTHL